nr:hypothetical protein [uncultured Brevundimonas sp.]
MALRNETGSDIVTEINGEVIRLASGESSKAFILAWGAQRHWTKSIRAGECAFLYMVYGYDRMLNLPTPNMTGKPTFLIVDRQFRLMAVAGDGDALGVVVPERR